MRDDAKENCSVKLMERRRENEKGEKKERMKGLRKGRRKES